MTSAFQQFLQVTRAELSVVDRTFVRAVYKSEIVRATKHSTLESFVVGKAPYYYRDPAKIAASIKGETDFTKAIRDALIRIPTEDSFKESHFAEILASIFVEHALGLTRLYSKLSLLTAENANAYKMDLVLFDPVPDPIEFVFAEVKSSPKHARDGLPAKHDRGCFASLFSSINKYEASDREFDLSAIEDRMRELPSGDQDRVRSALEPHKEVAVRYAGICVIDASTFKLEEAATLGARKNQKTFDVDLLCVTELRDAAHSVYRRLEDIRGTLV